MENKNKVSESIHKKMHVCRYKNARIYFITWCIILIFHALMIVLITFFLNLVLNSYGVHHRNASGQSQQLL